MAKQMAINPGKCIGCTTCALTCSITYFDEFNPEQAFVRIRKQDLTGIFEICFSSQCRLCKRCAQVCPTGALKIVQVEDEGATGEKS